MIEIKVKIEPYDGSHATGLGLSFTVKDERIRHAKLIDKSLEDVTLADAIQIVKEVAQEMLSKL